MTEVLNEKELTKDGLSVMMTVQDLAKLLCCSPRTVYRLADSGRVPPPARLGALVRWNPATVQAWMAAGCPAARTFRRGQNSRQ